jgi:acetolactate decarboxylase
MENRNMKAIRNTIGAVCIGLSIFNLISCSSPVDQKPGNVKVVGQMKKVMREGQLYGTIHLDTIADKTHLYGLGPVEYLAGEILIIDGKSYSATVVSDTTMNVEETYDLKAPFFGYANIAQWTEQTLPDSVQTIAQLEAYLDKATKNSPRPFLFKLSGNVAQASIHIVNLPKGATVSSPAEAHQGRVNYSVNDEQVEIIGFFSTEHQTIFTHHDTFLHMHLITADRQQMGHLDQVLLGKGMKLYLPVE